MMAPCFACTMGCTHLSLVRLFLHHSPHASRTGSLRNGSSQSRQLSAHRTPHNTHQYKNLQNSRFQAAACQRASSQHSSQHGSQHADRHSQHPFPRPSLHPPTISPHALFPRRRAGFKSSHLRSTRFAKGTEVGSCVCGSASTICRSLTRAGRPLFTPGTLHQAVHLTL